jgi:CDP-diacylglycerol--serine O-phosphatidyltransferase
MRPIRTIAVFPTLLTLGNLVCGFFAIVVAARIGRPTLDTIIAPNLEDLQNVAFSGWLIFLAMVFDGLDGYVARLSKTSSDFGAQLDSLCDCVTFGVAPGFLLVKMCPRFAAFHSPAVWIIAASFAACAALRLARFNVETSDEDEHLNFHGLPSPAAAATIASFAIMFYTLHRAASPLAFADTLDMVLQNVLPFFAILLGLLMVSRIPYPHVANQVFRGQRSFAHVVAVVFALLVVALMRGYALPIVTSGFVLYGPLRWAWEKFVRQRHREESIF